MKLDPEHSTLANQYLTRIFGTLSKDDTEQLFTSSKIKTLEAGEYLFEQGDSQDAFYIVLSGRLRVLFQNGRETQILGDVSAGEPVGELGLFTKEPRSASVVALRRSVVMKLDEEDYLGLVEKHPQAALHITNYVVNRLQRNAAEKSANPPPKNIAVIRLQPDFDITNWTDLIQQEFDAMDVVINVFDHENLDEEHIHDHFDEMENQEGINLLLCDEQHMNWANLCLTFSDLVLVVTDFHANSDVYAIEKHLELYTSNVLNKNVYLILLHPESAPLPTETRRWFNGRQIDLHLHLRKSNDKDARRFCRIVTHQAIGLVLGGGGAKGFAHIGATKALLEAGVELDFIGGTSAGGLFGSSLCLYEFDFENISSFSKEGAEGKPTSNDYHFPFYSLMTGKKMRRMLGEVFQETYLEDFWITNFCISTNYSTARLNVHETGLARQQVEASIAIPGVFPPVIIGNHLHVDGGVMDNLPIETMYKKPVKHVIAISLSVQSDHLVEIEAIPSAWEVFVNKITKKRRFRLPQISSILINSLTLNSTQKQADTKSLVSLYFELDLRKFGFLDWSKWEILMEQGYEKIKDMVNQLPEDERFW